MSETKGLRSGRQTAAAAVARAGALLLAAGILWGCARPAAAIGLATSSASRAAGSPEDASAAAASLDAFGFDLYRRVSSTGGNLVFSPASIAIALSMANAGARGETATQMESVLHSGAGAASGNGMNSLDQALAALSGSFPDGAGKPMEVKLHIANAPFAQGGMKIQQAYLDILASRYGAGLRLVDYNGDAAGACKLIDDWVSDQTEKRIPKLLDSLDPATRLVLVNAIYLKAPWQTPFLDEATADASFTRPDGTTVSVPTMNASLETRYASGSGWQAVELPYVGGSLAMTIVVPNDMTAFERSLDAARFDTIAGALSPAMVNLSLPRFKTETSRDLAPVLADMGMPLAMNPDRADFSGITSDEALYVSRVVHQANISLDEKGTEASAATAVIMASATAVPGEIVTLHVDRPFLFALRDTKTGAILFLGRIVDPSAT